MSRLKMGSGWRSGAELPETCSFDYYQLERLRQRFEGSRRFYVLVNFSLPIEKNLYSALLSFWMCRARKVQPIIGVVTARFECLPPSCDGLTGPDDHGPMISTGRLAVRGSSGNQSGPSGEPADRSPFT
ncbi:hypothetical protein F511_35076 [Dorcoceras hygrometricum]|uniref:Uncharacterized protein n=1 Tax=Dorcoceras hygrometricum TaxID=472368 RepID=A0A2Z7ASR9_9LAMI|nr:hypothetical protein F511_35076 [Dorcoceras hygrometricum]